MSDIAPEFFMEHEEQGPTNPEPAHTPEMEVGFAGPEAMRHQDAAHFILRETMGGIALDEEAEEEPVAAVADEAQAEPVRLPRVPRFGRLTRKLARQAPKPKPSPEVSDELAEEWVQWRTEHGREVIESELRQEQSTERYYTHEAQAAGRELQAAAQILEDQQREAAQAKEELDSPVVVTNEAREKKQRELLRLYDLPATQGFQLELDATGTEQLYLVLRVLYQQPYDRHADTTVYDFGDWRLRLTQDEHTPAPHLEQLRSGQVDDSLHPGTDENGLMVEYYNGNGGEIIYGLDNDDLFVAAYCAVQQVLSVRPDVSVNQKSYLANAHIIEQNNLPVTTQALPQVSTYHTFDIYDPVNNTLAPTEPSY